MPQAGFEPAPARFLRPPPLPLGYCGPLHFSFVSASYLRGLRVSAHSRDTKATKGRRTHEANFSQCSAQDSNLQLRGPRPRASAGWATRASPAFRGFAHRQWTPEGVEPSFPGCRPGVFPLDDGPKLFTRCEKDSNLQPRPSEGRARPNRAVATFSFRLPTSDFRLSSHGPGRIRTCTCRF